MLKRFLILALLLLPSLPVLAQSVSTEWVQRYNGPGSLDDIASDIAVDGSGNVYVTGWSHTSEADTAKNDYVTIKYNGAGDQLWKKTYNGPGDMGDYAIAIALDGSGNVYVTGSSWGDGTSDDYATIKYDSDGNELWVRRYDSGAFDDAHAMTVDASGNIYVTGYSTAGGCVTIKYNTDGTEIWTKLCDQGCAEVPYAIALDGSGNVYITGRIFCSGQSVDYLTIKYDALGNEEWVRTYNGGGFDEAHAIAVYDEDHVYVTGTCCGTESDYLTIRYDASGNEVWTKRYDGGINEGDVAYAIALDALGNIYVTGVSLGSVTHWDCVTVKYSASGSELWNKRYAGVGDYSDAGRAIAVYGSGHVYVTGYSYSAGTLNYLTLKYDAFSGNEVWSKTYNGTGNSSDKAVAIGLDGSGNVLVTGKSVGDGTGDDYATIKYDASGNEQWVERYNGPGDGDDGVYYGMTVDVSGNVYVTGYSQRSGTGYDYITIKYDASGNQLWSSTYNGTGEGSDDAWVIAVDDYGFVYVTGESEGDGTITDYATIRYFSSGEEFWVERYDGPAHGWDLGRAIEVDASGDVYVTGLTTVGEEDIDYATIKYNAYGTAIWTQTYDGPGHDTDIPADMAVDGFGQVYVTGRSVGSGTGSDWATIKYYGNGDIGWVRRYNGQHNGPDEANAIAVDDLGDVHVTGYYYSNATLRDYLTIKYDASGNELWVQEYDGDGNGWDEAVAIALDGSRNVYVTGSTYGSGGNYDYLTIKYDSDGNEVWRTAYDGDANGDDWATAIAVDGSGNVYVTGYSYGTGTDRDYVTIKYDRKGRECWVERYDGPGNWYDRANIIALDGSGCVYVTGYSYGSGTDYDIATIKYCQHGGGGSSVTTAYSPVDLIITDPFGDSIGVDFNTMADASYDTSQDLNGDGDNDDQITISNPYLGDYLIRVIAEPGADTGHYTLTMQMGDNGETVLIDSASVPSVGESDTASYTVMEYLKGDANSDGVKSIADAVFLINYLFKDGTPPDPVILGDANCVDEVTIADVVYLVNYLFRDGTPPCS